MKTGEVFKSIPTWAKGVTVVGILAIGTYIFFRFGNKISAFFKGQAGRKEDKEQLKETDDELKEIAKDNIVPSYSDAQYLAWAKILDQAFQGWGTDKTSVEETFRKLKNDADVLKLIQAYGTRTVASGNLNPEPDLKGTLVDAIGSEYGSKIELNKILSQRGIKFRF